MRESVLNLIRVELQETGLIRGWVLWDYGVGRDVLMGAMRDWRMQYPESYLMAIELPDDPEVIVDCIAAGAHAYVLQGAAMAQIAEMMRLVERGLFQCPIAVFDRLVEQLVPQRTKLLRPASLTNREWDVLYGIQQNQGDGEIAAELSISLGTVKYHVHNLLGKLNVQSRWQAMQLARDNDWFRGDRSSIDRQDLSKMDR
ncbi:MAG: response regulator transcription factor [Alkalinema sp. RU_4_3]|nr:response regulator transcription factor [Alkalinema sp. RU_4_3]